jgi:hypothetical protein
VKKLIMKFTTWWKSLPEPVRAQTPMVIGGYVLNLNEDAHQQRSREWYPRQRLQTRFR